MDTQQAYDLWASRYDTDKNKTRDTEAHALREMLHNLTVENCLEIGCGTGKNTIWLAEKAKRVLAVDLSAEMLVKAREKTAAKGNVTFKQADITREWAFAAGLYDLVSFSLVLEHIRQLGPVFTEAAKVLKGGGYLYVGELHPFKQYTGTKARFDTVTGRQVLDCFDHHISDFVDAAKKSGLELEDFNEHFDEDDTKQVPRIVAILFRKPVPTAISMH